MKEVLRRIEIYLKHTYIIFHLITDIIIVSLVVGCVVGVIWLAFWWYCGIPVLSTLLSLIVLGFLLASIVFYAGLGLYACV